MLRGTRSRPARISRRKALCLALSLAGGARPLQALAGSFPTTHNVIVATNLALAQSLTALGVSEFGVVNAWELNQNDSGSAHLPDTVFDIGAPAEPNLELLAALRPKIIFHSPGLPPDTRVLERVGPVVSIPVQLSKGEDALTLLRQMLFAVADALGRQDEARRFDMELSEVFRSVRARLRSWRGGPILALDITWGRIFATWGRGSLFDGVLREIGLRNAIHHRDQPVGWAHVSFQDLLAMDDVWGVHIGPIPETTSRSPVWPLLPFVRENRLSIIPEERMYSGGILTARSLAENLSVALGRTA